MSDGVEFRLQLEVTGRSEAVVTDFAIAHLKERGYAVTPPNENWETPREFNQRLGIHYETIHRALKRAGCPHVTIAYGPGRGPNNRRILSINSNAAFDAFILTHKRNKS